ncbi:MAG: hypothetical protein PVJ34_09955 [Anaerolineae bacterium]
MELRRWIALEVERRDWSFERLNDRAGLAPGAVQSVMDDEATPGWEFCLKVSWALSESPEKLFRLAGLLPNLPPAIEEEFEAISLLRSLSVESRRNILGILRDLAGHARQARQGGGGGEANLPEGTVPSNLGPERAERIRRLAKHIVRLPQEDQERVTEAFLMLLDVREGLGVAAEG